MSEGCASAPNDFPSSVKERLERRAHEAADDPSRTQRVARLRAMVEEGWFDAKPNDTGS